MCARTVTISSIVKTGRRRYSRWSDDDAREQPCWSRLAPIVLPPFTPQPKPQGPEDDEGHGTEPERYVVAACRHSYSEEDAKQLRKGDEPEQDRSGERRRPPLHLSALPSVASHYLEVVSESYFPKNLRRRFESERRKRRNV